MHFNLCRIGWIAQCRHKISAKYSVLQKCRNIRNLMFSVIFSTNLIAALPRCYLLLPTEVSQHHFKTIFLKCWYYCILLGVNYLDILNLSFGFFYCSVLPPNLCLWVNSSGSILKTYRYASLNFSSVRIIFVLSFIRKEHTHHIMQANAGFVWD